jgi:hypothetical protein
MLLTTEFPNKVRCHLVCLQEGLLRVQVTESASSSVSWNRNLHEAESNATDSLKKFRTTLVLSMLLCGSFGMFCILNNHSSLSTVR